MQMKNHDSALSKKALMDSRADSRSTTVFPANNGTIHKAAAIDHPLTRSTIKSGQALRAGLFGIGLEAYWPQYTGLKQRLEGYLGVVHDRIKREGVAVVDLGIVDSPQKAMERLVIGFVVRMSI